MKKKGFTLIELVITIGLVSALAVSLSIKIVPIFDKAKVSDIKHNLGVLRSSIEIYEIENGTATFTDLFIENKSGIGRDISDDFYNLFPDENLPVIKSGTNQDIDKKGIYVDGMKKLTPLTKDVINHPSGYIYVIERSSNIAPGEEVRLGVFANLYKDAYGSDIEWIEQ